VQIPSVDPGPTEVIGNPVRFDAQGQRSHHSQIFEVDGVGAADGERYAVHHQGESLAYAFQVIERLAAGYQIVFSDDFEPIDRVRLA
jgi:hypothetical protein